MDFSRADAALMASSGRATSMSFFRYVVMDETVDRYEDNPPWKSLKNNALWAYGDSDIGISTFQTP